MIPRAIACATAIASSFSGPAMYPSQGCGDGPEFDRASGSRRTIAVGFPWSWDGCSLGMDFDARFMPVTASCLQRFRTHCPVDQAPSTGVTVRVISFPSRRMTTSAAWPGSASSAAA